MRALRIVLGCLLALASSAQAADDNVRVSNLFNDDDLDAYWNVSSSATRQTLFNTVARDLGIATGYKNLSPGETLGLNGFEISLDTTIFATAADVPCTSTNQSGTIDCQVEADDQNAWRVMDADHRLTMGNAILLPRLRLRKGLPLSFEAGTDLTWMAFSHQTAVTVYGRFAPHEGMWQKTMRILPDVAFVVAGTRFMGNEELAISSREWDLTLGWTFPVAGVRDSYVGTFSPFFGLGRTYLTALPQGDLPDHLVDLTGVTGLGSKAADASEDSRAVLYDAQMAPMKLSTGARVTSGLYRFSLGAEAVLSRDLEGSLQLERPAMTVSTGFLF